MDAVIVAVGTELLADRNETNGPEVARRLLALGIRTRGRWIVPDGIALIAEALRRATSEAALVVVTGGLGPTDDDVTREAVSALTGCGLVHDPASLERVEAFARRRGLAAATDLARRQALVPEGSRAVPNLTGAAPGAVLAIGQAIVLLLPGPPAELLPMLDSALAAATELLIARGHVLPPAPGVARIVLAGIGEGAAAERVSALPAYLDRGVGTSALEVAWLTRPGEVLLELRCTDAERLAAAVHAACEELGRDVVARDGRGLADCVVPILIERFETVAVAESCTAGLVGAALTRVPGSSAAFRGGILAYANDVKSALLGVEPGLLAEHGAVSEETAAAMASGVRRALQADWGLSVTGIAGPGGGSDAKPVGTVAFGVARPDGRVVTTTRLMPGGREHVRLASAQVVLDLLRREL